jgi:hypothetical protein
MASDYTYGTVRPGWVLPENEKEWKDIIEARELETGDAVNAKTNGQHLNIETPTAETWFFKNSTAVITGITQANPGVVTAVAHGFVTGSIVTINGVTGMIQVNNLQFTVTVVTANTFSIGVDTTAYGAYVAGGTAQQSKPGQRVTYRKVIDFGGLPSAIGSKSVAHGISTGANFTITKLQAFASDTTGFNYIPIPYSSIVANDVIELRMNATNITIAVASNKSAFTTCYVIVEYLKN